MGVLAGRLGDLITPEELARLLKMREKTLANQRSRGEGPPFLRVGRSIRYSRAEVEVWLVDQQEARRGGAA